MVHATDAANHPKQFATERYWHVRMFSEEVKLTSKV